MGHVAMPAPFQLTDSPQAALDQPDEMIRGIFDPPSGFAVAAIARHKMIVCVFAVMFALLGAGIGLSRQSSHTASATLQVGQVNPNSPGFYSYVESAAALATAFSRAISAEPVLAAVQQKLHLAPSKVAARLSAEPVPSSPAFRVIATGPTGSAAIQLANVAANALITYESQSNSANPEAASLLHEYRETSLDLQHAAANVSRIELLSRSRHTPASTLDRDETKRNTAVAEKSAVALRLKAISDAYAAAVTSQAPRSGLVSLLAGATSASSNRKSKIETLAFIGLLAGIVIGCVAAILRERRVIDRRPIVGMADMQRSEAT